MDSPSSSTTSTTTTTTSSDTVQKKTILIVGAGLGGLVLANYLKTHDKNGICDIKIFERDQFDGARLQGYMIGINQIGMGAISESLTKDKFEALKERVFDESPSQFVIADRNLKLLLAIQRNQVVNRATLRQELIQTNNLSDNIIYSKRFVSYTEDNENGKVIANFEDGTSYTGDFLIGADGVRSAVRKQKVPDFKYADVNVFRISALIPMPKAMTNEIFEPFLNAIYKDKRPKEQSIAIKSLGNQQNSMILCKTNSLKEAHEFGLTDVDNLESIFNDNAGEDVSMVLWQYEYRPLKGEEIPTTGEAMLQCVKSRLSGYHPLVQKVVQEMTAPNNLLYGKAEPLTEAAETPFPPPSRVTILGDAAHCMVSHAGMGGNTAMRDGADLGQTILSILVDGQNLQNAMGGYETKMLRRGFNAVKMSRANTERIHARPVGVVGETIRNFFMRIFYKLICLGVIKLEE